MAVTTLDSIHADAIGGRHSTVLYQRLRTMAGRFLARERADHTLQPTALVHEALIRCAKGDRLPDLGTQPILPLAATVMREVLVDYARRKRALKRGGDWERHPLDSTCVAYEQRAVDLIGLDEALTTLGRIDPEAAQIVEMRFFGGLGEREIAELMHVSPRTIRRGWRAARMWLARELDIEA